MKIGNGPDALPVNDISVSIAAIERRSVNPAATWVLFEITSWTITK